MVDFSDTQIADIPVHTSVQEGVADQSAAISIQGNANAINTIAQGIQNFGSYLSRQRTANAKSAADGVISRFTQDQLRVASAVEQGEISSAEGRVWMRKNLLDYSSNNESLTTDLATAHKTIVNTSGMGKIVSEGTQEEQRFNKVRDAAYDANFIPLGATPEEEAAGMQNYIQTEQLLQKMELSQKQYALEAAEAGSDKAKLDLVQSRAKRDGQRLIGDLGVEYAQKTSSFLTGLSNQVETGKLAPEEALALAEQNAIALKTDIRLLGKDAGSDYILNMSQPITDMFEAFERRILGKDTVDIYDNQMKTLKTKQKLIQLGDEKVLKTVTASELLGHSITTELPINEAMVSMLGAKSVNPAPDMEEPEVVKDTQGYFKVIENGMSSDDEAVKEETKVELNKVLKGVSVYEMAVDEPQQYNELAKMLASTEFGSWVSRGNTVEPEVLNNAKEVLKRGYEVELLPLIKKEFTNRSVSIGVSSAPSRSMSSTPTQEFEPASGNIEVVFSGGGALFKPMESAPVGTQGFDAEAVAADLNRTVAPHLNRLVRMGAHLNGSTDYQKEFEENYLPQFVTQEPQEAVEESQATNVPETTETPTQEAPESPTDPIEEGDVQAPVPEEDDDLDLSDFVDQPIIEEKPDTAEKVITKFVPPTENPEVDQTVLSRYRGRRLPVSIRNNNMGAVSITGSIDKSWAARQPGFVGTSKRPKNEGGYYAKYATPAHGVGAASKLLENYGNRGINTASKIVRKWSVDKNAHNSYARTLVKYLNASGFDVSTTTKLDLSDAKVRIAILKAKSAHESGAGIPVYNDAVFEKGASYDFGGSV